MIEVRVDGREREVTLSDLEAGIADGTYSGSAEVRSESMFSSSDWRRLDSTMLWQRLARVHDVATWSEDASTTARASVSVPAHRRTMGNAVERGQIRRRMSKAWYIVLFVAGTALGLLGTPYDTVGELVSWVVWLVMLHRLWQSIPPQFARTTPGKAVGYLFIPFYNLYWLFNSHVGFATDYSRAVERLTVPASRPAPRLSRGLFVAYCLLCLASGAGAVIVRAMDNSRMEYDSAATFLLVAIVAIAIALVIIELVVMSSAINAANWLSLNASVAAESPDLAAVARREPSGFEPRASCLGDDAVNAVNLSARADARLPQADGAGALNAEPAPFEPETDAAADPAQPPTEDLDVDGDAVASRTPATSLVEFMDSYHAALAGDESVDAVVGGLRLQRAALSAGASPGKVALSATPGGNMLLFSDGSGTYVLPHPDVDRYQLFDIESLFRLRTDAPDVDYPRYVLRVVAPARVDMCANRWLLVAKGEVVVARR